MDSRKKTIDVRHMTGNFYPALKNEAERLPQGTVFEIIQTFDPIPLYETMEKLGYSHYTEQVSMHEYHAVFTREKVMNQADMIPIRPPALSSIPVIDESLGQKAVEFWDITWNDEKHFLSSDILRVISMANAVGSGHLRQATRELLKAYAHGLDSRALDDVFVLLVWNHGIGYFSSEIGPSKLFQAYQLIKKMEKKGETRDTINVKLQEKFGDDSAFNKNN